MWFRRRVVFLALAVATPVLAEPPPADGPWAWLAASGEGVRWQPGLPPRVRAAAALALPATLAFATTEAGETPAPDAAEAGGCVVGAEGVVVTHASVMAAAGDRRWLWARAAGGPWERVIPLATVGWADVGIGRLVSLRRRRPTVRWRSTTRDDLGAPLVSVGTPWGRWPVVSSARLDVRRLWNGAARALVEERRQRMLGSEADGATVLELTGEAGLSTSGALGAPVFAVDGTCLGLVGSVRADGAVVVRAADVVRPVVENVARHGAFVPATIGARLEGVGPPEAAGVLVQHVAVPGPSNGVLWEGDIVLALGGRGIAGAEPATLGLAFLSLTAGDPADVVVWRGGKPKRLSLTPRARAP